MNTWNYVILSIFKLDLYLSTKKNLYLHLVKSNYSNTQKKKSKWEMKTRLHGYAPELLRWWWFVEQNRSCFCLFHHSLGLLSLSILKTMNWRQPLDLLVLGDEESFSTFVRLKSYFNSSQIASFLNYIIIWRSISILFN